MALGSQRITPLPLETQAHIRSSVQITSLSNVVLDLVKNSLDANAEHIDVHLDFAKGYCSVLDDGDGILREEFLEDGGLARLYYTSKSTDTNMYGRYGRFLASLAGISLLSITSHHRRADSTNSVVLTDGKPVARSTDEMNDESRLSKHGTKVTVHNLFGKMPVRVKHRLSQLESRLGVEKEFAALKQTLTGLILAAARPFTLSVHEGTQKYLHRPYSILNKHQGPNIDLDYIVSTLFQANFLDSASSVTWQQASICSSRISIQAGINLDPAPSKSVQFISLNSNPLPAEVSKNLSLPINALFEKSSFGIKERDVYCQEVDRLRRGKFADPMTRGRREVDRWPMFYIRIQTNTFLPRLDDSTQIHADKLLSSVSGLLQGLFTEFLQSNGLSSINARSSAQQLLTLEHFDDSTSNLNGCSRIKSDDAAQLDFLSGLPFMNRSCSAPSSAVAESNVQANPESSIQWMNPRTGKILQLNPRTGMALPSEQLETLSIKNTHRELDDVMNSLSKYTSFPRVEQALRKITSNYSTPECKYDFGSNENTCTIGGRSLCISGPVSASSGGPHITKENLQAAEILGQVDGKFIMASLVSDTTKLVMIDQHAADERVKVEELFQQLCTNTTVPLPVPIAFEVNRQEIQRFQSLQAVFATWEIHYSTTKDHVQVSSLPELIVEKCRLEPKFLIDLLRKEVWREHSVASRSNDWLSKVSRCPQGVVDMLISRACRSAIMFNDKLSLEQCRLLVQRLSGCSFPFQCAHGRPSITILAEIQETEIKKESTFGEAWKGWI